MNTPKQTLSAAAQSKMKGPSAVRQRYAVGTTAQPKTNTLKGK